MSKFKLKVEHLLITMDMKIPTEVFFDILNLARQLEENKVFILYLDDPVFVFSLLG